MNIKTTLGQLHWLAILEGISYISFGLTMPLKYLYDIKGPNYVVGLLHGVLFIAYCLWVVVLSKKRKLGFMITFWMLFASLIPFATFIVDAKILKKLYSNDRSSIR